MYMLSSSNTETALTPGTNAQVLVSKHHSLRKKPGLLGEMSDFSPGSGKIQGEPGALVVPP